MSGVLPLGSEFLLCLPLSRLYRERPANSGYARANPAYPILAFKFQTLAPGQREVHRNPRFYLDRLAIENVWTVEPPADGIDRGRHKHRVP